MKLNVDVVNTARYPAFMPARKRPSSTVTAARRPRRQYHHGDLRAALIQAAAELVEATGPQGVSLRETARRCSVSQAAPYRHFASREALLAAVAAVGFSDFARVMETHAENCVTPLERLKAMGRGYVAFAAQRPETLRLMFGPECAGAEDAELERNANHAYALLSDTVAAALDQGQAPGLSRPVATIGVWALVHGLARLSIDLPGTPPDLAELDPQTRAARVIDSFVDGLLAGTQAPRKRGADA